MNGLFIPRLGTLVRWFRPAIAMEERMSLPDASLRVEMTVTRPTDLYTNDQEEVTHGAIIIWQ